MINNKNKSVLAYFSYFEKIKSGLGKKLLFVYPSY
jgi:hypothetical protein